jgi:hypothetical protein
MKLKISKSQWEGIGKKTGWDKTAGGMNVYDLEPIPCKYCSSPTKMHGTKMCNN